MFENLVKTVMSAVSKAAAGAADCARGLTSRPALPTVKIESRIQALYACGLEGHGEMNKTRAPGSATEIVVHGTGGGDGTIEQFVDWQLGGELKNNWNRGIALVHYVIGRNGAIVQTVDPNRYWTWHSTSYMHDTQTVGIELCNTSPSNATPYTNEQYRALAGLCDLIMRDNKDCKQIQSHNWTGTTYSGSGKACPGTVFDWQHFIDELAARKIAVKRIQPEVLSIV